MKKSFSEKWIYIIREITIVVIGVLMAFMLNSWWSNARDKRTKKVILSNLLDEMVYNNKELQRTINIHQFVLKHTIYLEDILSKTQTGEEVTIHDTTLTAFTIAATYNPSSGSLNSLLTSGKLDFLSNNKLITSITTWNNQLEDATEDEQTAFNFIENQFLPYLRQKVNLSELLDNSRGIVYYAHTGSMEKIPADFIKATVTLKYDYTFINLVAQRKMRLAIVLNALNKLLEHQQTMLDLLKNGEDY